MQLTTELDAVNTMLDVIGEAPVTTLEDSGLIDAAMARDLLRRTSREVQGRGWHWNTDPDVSLLPVVPLPGIIPLPSTALSVDPTDHTVDAVARGGRLWDRRRGSDLWEAPVRCRVVWLLPFEDLPEPARAYIAIRAARIWQDRRIGSESRSGLNERDEIRALVALENDTARNAGHSFVDSWHVARTLNLRSPLGASWR